MTKSMEVYITANVQPLLRHFDGAKERTLLVNSLSKSYAMTGWRVGFLAAPKAVIENALKAGQNSITCVAPFIQKAAAFALTDPRFKMSLPTCVLPMRAAVSWYCV